MKKIGIGLVGFGTVGTGVVKILQQNKEVIEDRLGASIILKRIADIDITTDRGIKVDRELLTTNVQELIDDPEISILIELIAHSHCKQGPAGSSWCGDIQKGLQRKGGHRL
ncbi:MAG: homoserine dehydrogenase [bacterium]|nr:MAG: homoserine dehydrogenase [bacterium]